MTEPQSGQPPAGDGDPGNLISGPVRNQGVSARVPESVSRGVFSTGVIIMTGTSEFIIDFILRMSHPHRVVARVIMPASVVPQVITAMRENLGKYINRFGPVPQQPKPEPGAQRPTIQEIYDDLRLPDELLAGAYANAVIVGHTSSEFYFDFLATFYPRSAVSSRVFLSAPQVPGFLDALSTTNDEYVRKYGPKRNVVVNPAPQVPLINPIPQVQASAGSPPVVVPPATASEPIAPTPPIAPEAPPAPQASIEPTNDAPPKTPGTPEPGTPGPTQP